MKQQIALTLALLAAGSAALADADATNKVNAAIAKLKAADNYSWTTSVDGGTNAQRMPSQQKGKVNTDGSAWLTSPTGDFINKGTVTAFNRGGVWTSTGGRAMGARGPGRGMVSPAANQVTLATGVLASVKDLTAGEAGLFNGDFTDEGAELMLSLPGVGGGRGGVGAAAGTPPAAPKNAKGTAKFWVKDGNLVKFQTHLTGTVTGFDGADADRDVTRTVEFYDIGTTKFEIPAEAKQFFEAPPAQK